MRLSNIKRVSKRYASRTYTELACLTRIRLNGIGLWSNFKNLPHVEFPLQHGKRLQAPLLSLAVISPGSTQAAKPPLLSARPTPKESAPAFLLVMAK